MEACARTFIQMSSAGGRGKWRHGGGARPGSLGQAGRPSASPWPTLEATGPWPVLAWLPLALGELCLTVQHPCVRFHSASDSQSSGLGLLVFSKSRCGRTARPPEGL